MRTKPISKLIHSVRFHLKNHDSFKINDDIRNVIKVTEHFQNLSNKMTKYPDMDVSKKLINYLNDLHALLNHHPDFPDFQPDEQKQFINELLTVYEFIYYDLQDKCQVKTVNASLKVAKSPAFKKKWRSAEAQLKQAGNVVLDSHFASYDKITGALIISYLPKRTIQKAFK